ncbi:uncharacterized protein LOC134676003 [Cydia fagiglandana]|uniref:uncharacterized protein LOC134676003 n=1 Tax=Cydia fagiglandana TaxID=1458189 RepID=UPI002FEDFFD5
MPPKSRRNRRVSTPTRDDLEPAREGSFTRDDVATLVDSLQRSQTNAFRELLESVITTSRHPSSSTTSTPFPVEGGNFSRCKARFAGNAEESIEGFIDAIEAYKDCANISDDNAIRGLSMLLTHSAADWWQGIKPETTSWTEVVDSLRHTYGDNRAPPRIYRDLFATPQGEENTHVFVAKCRALLAKLPRSELAEKVQLDMVYGLLNKRIRKRVKREECATFKILLQKARAVEESLNESTNDTKAAAASKNVSYASPSRPVAVSKPPRATASASAAPPSREPRAPPPRRLDDNSDNNTASASAAKSKSYSKKCGYCKRYGHVKEECRKLNKDTSGTSNDNNNNTSDVNVLRCYGCGQVGVIRANCEKCNATFCTVNCSMDSSNPGLKDTGKQTKKLSPVSSTLNSIPKVQNNKLDEIFLSPTDFRHALPANFFGDGLVAKPVLPRAADSSQDDPVVVQQSCTLFAKSIIDNSDKQVNCPLSKEMSFCTVSNNISNIPVLPDQVNDAKSRLTTAVLGSADNSNKNGHNVTKYSKSSSGHSIDNSSNSTTPCEGILFSAVDFSGTNQKDEDSKEPTPGALMDQNDSEEPVLDLFDTYEEYTKRHQRPILGIGILDMQGIALVDTGAKRSLASRKLYSLLLERQQQFCEKQMRVTLADGVTQLRNVLKITLDVKVKDRVIPQEFLILPEAEENETLLGIDFLKASRLDLDFDNHTWCFPGGEKYPIQYESDMPTQLSIAASNILHAEEGSMLSEGEKMKLAEVLERNSAVFSLGGAPTPIVEHHIDTGDHAPISVPPYRLTPAKKEIMKAEIEKMLREGIIEECESAWTSPAVLVPKKNNTVRFCADYRKLNSVTKTDNYPLPLIDELLQSTGRHCYISTIDLRSGYWQVSVNPADRDKTSVITPFGTYRFVRMPFGLKNAPATFQRLMDKFKSGASLQNTTVLAYLDDLLVISDSFEKHLQDLQLVFDRLRQFGLRANREKCVFACKEVKYLGHLITPDGIKPDNGKIEAILAMKEPTNLKHLRTFLQTCAWFRKFVPNFSAVAQPLTKLTKKNEPWKWQDEQQQAFTELKTRLTSAPILVQADYSKQFILRTDSSNYALGACLMQGEGHDERPIEYASRLLTPAERRYSTTERECLAVIWAVEKYRPYIDGHTVLVKTDHQPLKWLLTHKSPSGRLIRWALKLQGFDIKYEYTPGKANVIADTLSRPVCDENSKEECGVCSISIDIPQVNPTELPRSRQDYSRPGRL